LWESMRGFNFQQTCAVMIVIIICVVIIDLISQRLRKAFI
ncbi:MAG: phosphonate transport system permease protein, partial [Marinomonas primoryensis]